MKNKLEKKFITLDNPKNIRMKEKNQNNKFSFKPLNFNNFTSNKFMGTKKIQFIEKQISEPSIKNKNSIFNKNNLKNHFNNRVQEDENLNRILRQTKCSIKKLQGKVNILKNENKTMNNKINLLQTTNEDLNNKLTILYEQNNNLNKSQSETNYNLNYFNNNKNIYFKEIKGFDDKVYSNEDYSKNDLYSYKIHKNKIDKDSLEFKKNKIKEIISKNSDKKEELKKKNLIINSLKNQILLLKDNLFQFEEDKNKIEKIFENEKNINNNKIYGLSILLKRLNIENEKLKKIEYKNKRLNKKLKVENNILIHKIKRISKDLYDIELNIKRQQRRFSLSKNIKNNGVLNTLENENNDLKIFMNKYRKMLNILFLFINELNDLNEHSEIEIEQCYCNLQSLINNINQLRNEIYILLEKIENNNDSDLIQKKKWDNMHKKLFPINLNNKTIV